MRSGKGESWHKEPSVLVAIMALLVSAASAYFTYRQGAEQDVQATRSELGQLIQRVSDLSRDASGISQGGDSPSADRKPAIDVSREQLVLAGQAADIIRRIPDHVSAHECLAVAQMMYRLKRFPESEEIANIGLRKKLDRSVHPVLSRISGGAAFKDGRYEDGRRYLEKALDAAPLQPSSERDWSRAYTEIFWAAFEERSENCTEAAEHTRRAEALISQLSSSKREQMEKYLKESGTLCT